MVRKAKVLRPALMRHNMEQSLLAIGERICRNDYAVRHYKDPQHPKFYGKFEQLLKALRRAIPGVPKKTRGCYLRWIDAILSEGITYNGSFSEYESCGDIIADAEWLLEALLRLPEDILEQLIMDASDALDDSQVEREIMDAAEDVENAEMALSCCKGNRPSCGHPLYQPDGWVWLGQLGVSTLPSKPGGPSKCEFLLKQLNGKSHYAALQQVSIGLIELVDHLKGQALNPFWHYYDIALMVEGRLPVESQNNGAASS